MARRSRRGTGMSAHCVAAGAGYGFGLGKHIRLRELSAASQPELNELALPHKAMACGWPVVASRTASSAWVLRDFPGRLVSPGDAAALAGALAAALDLGTVDYGPQPDWGASGAQLEAAMQRIGDQSG